MSPSALAGTANPIASTGADVGVHLIKRMSVRAVRFGCRLPSTLVIRLLCPCGPTAVARLVVAVVVNSIEAQSCWFLSHVGKKVLEFQPSFTNRDPSSAVMLPRLSPRITTAAQHRRPYRESSGLCHAVSPLATAISTMVFFRWVAISSPAVVVRIAQAARGCCFRAVGNTTLMGHREPILSGVTGRAVSAAPSFYFTRKGARHGE